jgi:predicted TIM-barrel fold metal-dependent hydrolase
MPQERSRGPYARRLAPAPAVSLGRALRRWKAKGPCLGAYAPRSTLELASHTPHQASVPAIDFHTHLGRWLTPTGNWMEPDVRRLLDLMDSCNITGAVNLDGRWGQELEENLERYDRAHPGRFFTFCHVDWRLLDRPSGPELLVSSLERSVAAGARGLKVWKDLGMQVTVGRRRILPDDRLLDPIWDAAAALGVPVLIHVADPIAFFQPVDNHNERLEELLRHPGNSRAREGLDEFRRLLNSFENMVASHPGTTIVAAHGCYTENLARVSALLDHYPNLRIDIAWRAQELGRQPRAARALVMRHPDRVLFGTDVFPQRATSYHVYFRLLETDDEAFPYSDDEVPGQGRWLIYGLDLPESVLERVYRDNASSLLGLSPARPSWPAG